MASWLFFSTILLTIYNCNCDTLTLYRINCSSNYLSGNEVLLGETISGLYTYQTSLPSLWMEINGWADSSFWLNTIQSQYGNNINIIYNNSFQSLNGLILLTNYLQSTSASFKIDGYLLANLSDKSLHYALSLAFHYNALIATDSITENALTSSPLNLKLLRDFTKETNTYKSVFNEFKSYNGNVNNFIIFQELTKYQYLSDFVIFSNSFIFYSNNMNTETVSYIFNELSSSNKARLLGWGQSEGDLVGTSSKYNISVVASDWSENLSQFYILNLTTPKTPITPKTHITPTNPDADQYHYVTFLFTDGDNLQWLQNGFFNEQWYGSNLRGSFPVSWTISGSVQELAPIVYTKIIQNATQNDSFAMGPSGFAYEIISECNDIVSFGVNTGNSVATSDNVLSSVNVIDNWNSKNGDYSSNINVMFDNSNNSISSILYYYGNAYCGGNGNIYFYKNYPIITGKQALWSGHNNYQQLAKKLNSYPVNPKKAEGYSLIPVHVWSQSMLNVSKCIQLLNDNVKVVGINDFVDLVTKNIVH